MQCSKCGNALAAGIAFCGHCGTPVTSSPPQQQPAPQQPTPQSQPFAQPTSAPAPQQPTPQSQPFARPTSAPASFQQSPPVTPPPSSQAPPPYNQPQQHYGGYAPIPQGGRGSPLKIILLSVGGLILVSLLIVGVLVGLRFLSGGLPEKQMDKLGFECELITYGGLAEQSLKEDKEDGYLSETEEKNGERLIELQEDRGLADKNVLECKYEDEEEFLDYQVDIFHRVDIDLLTKIAAEVVCETAEEMAISDERIKEGLESLEDFFTEEASIVIGDYIYLVEPSYNIEDFEGLLDEEDIDYENESYEPPTLSCNE